MIDHYDKFWQQMKAGQGFSGAKTVNAHTMFNALFDVDETVVEEDPEIDEIIEDSDDAIAEVLD